MPDDNIQGPIPNTQVPLILAHDLGTTGNKATLFDATGVPVGATFVGYETAYPQPNWAEQPNAAAQARYAELYPLFQETYRALEPIYERLGKK